MLFRKHIVSTRTLLQLTVAAIFFAGGVGAALAANNGIAPLLVPYTVNTIAGTPQFIGTAVSPAAGYFGEGVPATTSLTHGVGTAAVLDAPYDLAVDSVGNVYITDTNNYIIREVNAQTGLITTIAGVLPKGCSGSACTLRTSGCADGVPAAGAAIGSKIQGIAVDSYGNVYFDDATTATVSVIYRGGTRVANFIALENPTAVAASGGSVQSGYIYHIAGTINLASCSGTLGTVDNVMAYQNGQLHGPELISLDSAGNIYIADTTNATVRVINTQATPQTFFQYTVQPGYIRSITNCNPTFNTGPCPTGTVTPWNTNPQLNTNINGPVNALVYDSQFKNATVDAYGNLYQLNGTGSGTGPPGIYGAVAYAGGTPLTNLLTAEAPSLAPYYGPTVGNAVSELPLTYGNSYVDLDNPSLPQNLPSEIPDELPTTASEFDIRPASLRPDVFGTFWYLDTHFPELERIDQYTSLATLIIREGRATANISPINSSPASLTNPYYCVYGNTGSNLPWTQGPQTYDPQGDGCPAIVAFMGGNTTSGPDALGDGLGNIYISDAPNQIMREIVLGNSFPATAVGTTSPVTQAIQVHFNSNNPPAVGVSIPDGAAVGNTTTAFSIAPGISDFTINTTTPEFPMGSLLNGSDSAYGNYSGTPNFQMWAGLPTCTALGAYPTAEGVSDLDCLVYVTFNPTAPGVRQSQLVVTTANGSIYHFSLSGIGTGGQLAIDGGTPTPVAATGLGTTAGIAVSQSGAVYIADPTNNRIVVEPSGSGTQTTIGPSLTGVTPATLNGPMGVALDSDNNVYISDTGNNRILKIDSVTGAASVLGNYLWIPGSTCDSGSTNSPCPSAGLSKEPGAAVSSTTPPPQYAFNAPEGLAVDAWNNVYVADTGNSAVVEIPSNTQLGGAVPLLSYPGAPKFVNPVAVAVDSQGNVYVADTKVPGAQIIKLPPGGGDLINPPGASFQNPGIGVGLQSPNGVAVDAAGNVYVSDNVTNEVVEVPAASGPGSSPFALNFTGLSAPAGLAVDANGNLYVADTGNKQVLFDNRQNPMVNFGTIPQDLTSPPAQTLTITNIGSQPVTLVSPFTNVTSVTPTGSTAFSLQNGANVCAAGPLPAGLTCSITANFDPTADGPQGESFTVNGSSQTVQLVANGEQPLANIVLSASYSTGTTPTAGATATVTATVTQPFIHGNTPTGSVIFTYTVDAANKNANSCGTSGTTLPINLTNGVASFQLPTLATGVQYTVTAVYSGDSSNTTNTAAPLLVAVPGTPVTVTVTSTPAQLTFTYGSKAPTPVGTVTPTPPSPITFSFGSAASATTPVGTYPVTVSFSGTGACAYGFPTAVFSGGTTAAVVTENLAPLTYTIPSFTALYGAANISYGANAVVTGAVNGDSFSATFTPAQSSILNVGTYSVVPTVIGAHVGDYTVTAKPSTLTITQAPVSVSVTLAHTQVAATTAGVSSAVVSISVATAVSAGKGTPSGQVTVTDVFTPITATGIGTAQAPVTSVVNLTAGFGSFTPFAPTGGSGILTPGMHQYSFAYSGDSNFQPASVVPSATAAACTPSTPSTNCVVVDNPDFTITSATGPVQVDPGVVPSGNGLLPEPNQNTSYPETAVLFVNGVLGFSGQITLTCQTQNPSYVSCFMTPTSVTIAASGTGTTAATVVAVQTPATLPLGFNFGTTTGELRRSASRTVLAFLPFGLLAFCVRRRRRLSKALWMLMVVSVVSAGMSGCGGNQVAFYTPVPTGPQTVTVTATYTGGTGQPAATRQFIVPISID